MKIGIAGPIATDNIANFLYGDSISLPHGYYGAPLLGTLIGALLERGHEIVAFTTSADIDPSAKPIVAEGERFKIYYCPARRRAFRRENGHWGRAMDAFRLERAALSLAMRDARPDIIHAHWTYEFAWAAIDSGLPHLVTCHDAPQVVLRYMPDLYRLVRYFMARHVLAHACRLTAVSPYLQEKVERYARVPLTVVPNPLPDELINREPRKLDFTPDRPRIAMVLNGWGKLKNPQPAIRAFASFRRRIPGAKMVLIGHDYGPGEHAQRWADAGGLSDGIRFVGAIPHAEVLSNLASADILLHPSLEETFGMSVAEAMALGVPVIGGARSGAVPWVIGEGGILTDVSSVAAIEQAMHALLGDPDRYRRCAETALESVHQYFTSDRIAGEYEVLYRHAADMGCSQTKSERESGTLSSSGAGLTSKKVQL